MRPERGCLLEVAVQVCCTDHRLSVWQPVCLALLAARMQHAAALSPDSVTGRCRAHRQQAGQAGGGAAGPPPAEAAKERAPHHATGDLAALRCGAVNGALRRLTGWGPELPLRPLHSVPGRPSHSTQLGRCVPETIEVVPDGSRHSSGAGTPWPLHYMLSRTSSHEKVKEFWGSTALGMVRSQQKVRTVAGLGVRRLSCKQGVQALFEQCQASMDPNSIAQLLAHHPYHIDALLAMFELYRFAS